MSVNSKMKAIADNIRLKTGGTKALNLDQMAESIDEVYEKGYAQGGELEYQAGYESGMAQGRDEGYSDGYDAGRDSVNPVLYGTHTFSPTPNYQGIANYLSFNFESYNVWGYFMGKDGEWHRYKVHYIGASKEYFVVSSNVYEVLYKTARESGRWETQTLDILPTNGKNLILEFDEAVEVPKDVYDIINSLFADDVNSPYEMGEEIGYEEGHNEGYASGKEDGYSDGKTAGLAEGYGNGYEAGRNSILDNITPLPNTVVGNGFVNASNVSEIPHDVSIKSSETDTIVVCENNLFDFTRPTIVTLSNKGTAVRRLDNGVRIINDVTSQYWGNARLLITDNLDNLKGKTLRMRCRLDMHNEANAGGVFFELYDGTAVVTRVGGSTTSNFVDLSLTIPEDTTATMLTALMYARAGGESVAPAALGEYTDYTGIIVAEEANIVELSFNKNEIKTVESRGNIVTAWCSDNETSIEMTYNISRSMQKAYDDLWNVTQNRGKRERYNYAFYSRSYNFNNFFPTYDIIPTEQAIRIFCEWNDAYFHGRDSLSKHLERLGRKLDFSKATNLEGAFYYNQCFTEIPRIDVTNCTTSASAQNLFSNAIYLETIEELVVNENNVFNNWFTNCSALKNLTIVGTIGQNGFNLQWSKKLSYWSIRSIIESLSTTTSGLSITLSLEAVDKAFAEDDEYGNINVGTNTETWYAFIDTRSNWTINLV